MSGFSATGMLVRGRFIESNDMSVEREKAPTRQGRIAALRQALSTRPARTLIRFLGVLVTISVFTSLYVWQTSSISSIDRDTALLSAENIDLERDTVALMLQLAQWEGPAYIDQVTLLEGMVPGRQPIYVRQAPPDLLGEQALPELELIWQRMLDLLPIALREALDSMETNRR